MHTHLGPEAGVLLNPTVYENHEYDGYEDANVAERASHIGAEEDRAAQLLERQRYGARAREEYEREERYVGTRLVIGLLDQIDAIDLTIETAGGRITARVRGVVQYEGGGR